MDEQFASKLEKAILPEKPDQDIPEAVKKFAPPSVRNQETRQTMTVPQATVDLYAARNATKSSSRTKLQTIAEFTSQLPFREAMAMARGILGKLKTKENLTEEQLAAAIQDWAWEGETFTEERRPGVE